jgi:hypothetical protein
VRHEVLYQYDLPIEVLDDIPRTEEVLEVLYARSKENYLVPILLTRLRILWAYPETSVAYRLFELNYADLVRVHVKFTVGLPAVMTADTVHGEKNVFNGVRSTPEEVRAALLTLKDTMQEKVGGEWKFLHKQNLLAEEYLVKESDAVLQSVPKLSGEDLFEDRMMPGLGCYEPAEKLFDHFPQESEDVFEAAAEEDTSPAMVTRIARMIESAEEPREEPATPLNDVTVFDGIPAVTDDQWKIEDTGDAEILPGTKKKVPESAPPEVDDSVVYGAAAAISAELERLPKSIPASRPGRQLATPLPRASPSLALSITLEPRESLEEGVIDRCLEDLKFLRDNGVFSESEYKERCLRLFKRTGL